MSFLHGLQGLSVGCLIRVHQADICIRLGCAEYIRKGLVMETNTRVIYLVTTAAKTKGSYAALARDLQVAPQTVNNWRACEKPCPPEYRAAMAGMLGEDVGAELTRATLERHAGTPRYAVLAKYMGGHVLATGGPLAVLCTAAAASWLLMHMEIQSLQQIMRTGSTWLGNIGNLRSLLDTMYSRNGQCLAVIA
jgi:hypothetical protein